MTVGRINPGDPIRAAFLNQLGDGVNRICGPAGRAVLGGGLSPDLRRPLFSRCVVIARTLTDVESDGSVRLDNAEYTVRLPDDDIELVVPWDKRVCHVQPDLIGPAVAAADAQLFWPAPVFDSAEATREPWRARGVIEWGWQQDGTARRWHAHLYGEMPYRDC